MKKILFPLVFAIAIIVNAQEDKLYKSLELALENPEMVYQLDLGFDKLENLPDSIQYLTNLKFLKVSSNKFTELPEVITRLKSLKELDISFNSLTNLSESISKLQNLEKLKLSSNQLTSLPESIAQLKMLKDLDVSFNKLVSLPESIGELTNLTNLRISSNQLTSLPESISKLEKLPRLDLGFNRFDSLPESILTMTNLLNFEEIKLLKQELIEKKQRKIEQEEQERIRLEEMSKFDYQLDFDPNTFVNVETGEFDDKAAFAKLPWQIDDIYDYLKTKKNFIYKAEQYSYKTSEVTRKTKVGYRMVLKENGEIESLSYNYSKKEYIKRGGMFKNLKSIISKDSTSSVMKFMPFQFLMVFRVQEETETIIVNKTKYECIIVEGAFMFEKVKYWMVKDTPGLIVKIMNESDYSRETWLLQKVK